MDSESQLQQRGDNFITNKELKMNNKIRVARAELRMTQQQLAEAAGVSRQTINAIESGKFVPSTVLALKMAKIFNRPVEEIFQLDDED
jgi:putative transcriptional regulator